MSRINHDPFDDDSFRERYEQWSAPWEYLVDRQIAPAEALNFIKGCRTVSDIVRQVRPEALFIPERGATPVNTAITVFLGEEADHYDTVFLPIGTKTDPNTGQESGFTVPEKQELISSELDRLRAKRQAAGISSPLTRPFLADEVQTGGAIKRAAHILQWQLEDKFACDNLVVAAMQDTRVPHIKKAKGFGTMLANERPGITAFSVNLPQVFMDRSQLLNTLLLAPDEPLDRLRIVHNHRASRFIGAMAVGLTHPDRFTDAINEVTNSESVSASAESWIESYLRLCEQEHEAKDARALGRSAVSFFSYPDGQA